MIEQLCVGDLSTNCWIISLDKDPGETGKNSCVVIDPGADADVIITRLEALNLHPKYILLTHGHFDHIGALPEVLEKFGSLNPEIAIHGNDAKRLGPEALPVHMADFASASGGAYVKSLWKSVPSPTRLLNNADQAGPFRVLHTPGHTPGSVCFYDEQEGLLFSGDTLFQNGIGRTDLPGGDWKAMEESLSQLALLPGNTRVFPGHGPATTIKAEFGRY